MKLHRNAKSTPSSRLALVRRVLFEGHSYAEAAEGFAVSTRTVAKWVRRFKDGGVAALEDGSSRPGALPHQTALTRRGRSRPVRSACAPTRYHVARGAAEMRC